MPARHVRTATLAALVTLAAAPGAAHAQFGRLLKRAAQAGGGAVRGAADAAAGAAASVAQGAGASGNARGVRVPLPGEGASADTPDPRRLAYEACLARALETPGPSAVGGPAFARSQAALNQRLLEVGQRVLATSPGSPAHAALQDSATMLGEAMARAMYPGVAARCGPEVWPARQPAAPGAGGARGAAAQAVGRMALATATATPGGVLLGAGLKAGRAALAARKAARAAEAARPAAPAAHQPDPAATAPR